MSSSPSLKELRTMQVSDLRTEATDKRLSIVKLRMGIAVRSEQDTAKLRRERKELARLLTVIGEKTSAKGQKAEGTALKTEAKEGTVPARASSKKASKPARAAAAGSSSSTSA